MSRVATPATGIASGGAHGSDTSNSNYRANTPANGGVGSSGNRSRTATPGGGISFGGESGRPTWGSSEGGPTANSLMQLRRLSHVMSPTRTPDPELGSQTSWRAVSRRIQVTTPASVTSWFVSTIRGLTPNTPSGPESPPSWLKTARTNLHVEDPRLLRGMPLASGLSHCATVLSDRTPTEAYFKLSSPCTRFDTFISHNWSTPRWKKFLVLIFHFNLSAAMVTSTIIAVATCALTALDFLPTTYARPLSDEVASFYNKGQVHERGLLCMPLGLAAFILTLFAIHEVDCLFGPWRRHTIFLDKCCVSQVDADLKKQGIQCLAAFLQRSDDILVLYNDIYLQRLWTVYEVASWLLLHKGKRMIVRPVLVPELFLGWMCVSTLLEVLFYIVIAVPKESRSAQTIVSTLPILLSLGTFILGAWLSAKLAADRDRIDKQVATFSLSQAKCFSEDDREIVQRNIVAFMKYCEISEPEEEDGTVFVEFEELVRTEVPKLMWSSMSFVGVPYHWAVCPFLPMALAALDVLAGLLIELDGGSTRYICLMSAFNVLYPVLTGPLIFAMIALLTRHRHLRSLPACVGIGVVATLAAVGVWVLLEAMTLKAEESDGWLAAVISSMVLLVVTTCLIFRPLAKKT